MNNLIRLQLPLRDSDVLALHAGDSVLLSGVLLTGRDAAHQWLVQRFIHPVLSPSVEDQRTCEEIRSLLKGGAIYHCGPVVQQSGNGHYRFISAGPTTSIREEAYEAAVMHYFGLKAVIGKGGMGEQTLQACSREPAVYLHATGGTAALLANCVKEVVSVYKPEFGIPEAMWLIRVEAMPLVVSMDAYGCSLHEKIRAESQRIFEKRMD